MKKLLVLLLMATLIQASAVANITTGSWLMNQSNTFADGVNYGQVGISANDGTGVVTFTVDAFTAPYASTSNFGIQTFGFNSTVSIPDSAFALPSGWSPTGTGSGFGPFGPYLERAAGTGSTRQDPLVFTIQMSTFSDAVASNFALSPSGGQFFAAHVAGFTVTGSNETSHMIGGGSPTIVPAPAAILLGGIGTCLVGWLRRKRTL